MPLPTVWSKSLRPRAAGRGAARGGVVAGLLLVLAAFATLRTELGFAAPPVARSSWSATAGSNQAQRAGGVARAQEGPDAAVEYQVDDTVEAVFEGDGGWYAGVVVKDNGDGTFEVKWDDPGDGPETSACKPEDMKKVVPKTALQDLKVGSKVKGRVSSVREFGAFVDIGAERDGLVHVSKMPTPEPKTGPFMAGDAVEAVFPDDGNWYAGTVEKVAGKGRVEVRWEDAGGGPEVSVCKAEEVKHFAKSGVEQDEEVEVWIERVTEDGKLQLTMVPPPDLTPFIGLHPMEWLDGKVVSIAKFGVFVNVKPPMGGFPQRGLVHVSRIKEGRVEDPWAEVEEGQEVKVRVVDVDLDNGKLSLAMTG